MTTHTTLGLSDLIVVDALKKSRYAAIAEAKAEQACRALGIYLPNLRDYNTMSAYLFPYTSADKLFAITVFNNLLFYIDDCLDRNDGATPDSAYRMSLFARLIHTFTSGEVRHKGDVLEEATAYVREVMLPLADKRWLKRLIANTKHHLEATTASSGVERALGGKALLEHFMHVRQHDSGMVPTVDLIEFASGVYLPDEVHRHPTIVAAKQETTLAAALMNDIFSYHREVILQGSDFNLIAVMGKAYGLGFARALGYSIDTINGIIASFLAREEALPVYQDPQLTQAVRDYYAMLKDQINAAWHWQLVGTNRYRASDSPFEELRHKL